MVHGREKGKEITTYLLATLSILPVLVTKSGQTTLLGDDALRLLEGVAHSASGDLGVFVEAVFRVSYVCFLFVFG